MENPLICEHTHWIWQPERIHRADLTAGDLFDLRAFCQR
jgi:hypothetical protein